MSLINPVPSASETIKGIKAIASNAEILAGADDTKAVTPLKAKQLNEAKNLGLVQTWQDVTGSRAYATTYTNSTGRPLAVSIKCACSSTMSIILTVAGVVVSNAQGYNGAPTPTQVFAIIPVGATYALTQTGSPAISAWLELR